VKLNSLIIFFTIAFFLAGCGDNKATTNKQQETNTSPSEKKEEPASTLAPQNDEIIGEWEQEYTCYDKNGNYRLDAEEKKPSNTKVGFDWFRFNADGSCLRDKEVKFKSLYEIQNKGDTKELSIQNVHDFTIIELTDKELILGGDGAFMVFKKI
jgi:hypothetical protein